ncbi:uncharacterized protein KY384_007753 [Bacidia gigantensis]|uniref:uncharacterized protein n=1 Tax=Bacidia gigantensis TaxID=2732470 RepID=UPI001D053630|nr:uncharacterized protein KY384_007753 [Bacidia gigantensis]KAG8527600.1 hypothetical protein KY384_007753 [Bacidia gigantensis]
MTQCKEESVRASWASNHGVGPNMLSTDADTGGFAVECIKGNMLLRETAREYLPQIIKLLRSIHSAKAERWMGKFEPVNEVKWHLPYAAKCMPPEEVRRVKTALRNAEVSIKNPPLVPCHNKFHCRNIMLEDSMPGSHDGARLLAIDFENCDLGDPMWDVASLAADLEHKTQFALLKVHGATEEEKRRLRIYLPLVKAHVLILCVFILCVLSLYWAVLFHVERNTSSLTVYVVDFDATQPPYTDTQPLIGPMVTQTTKSMLGSPMPHLGYITKQPSDFANDPMKVRQAVYDFHVWAAIIVNANATALLRAAVSEGNPSYDPLGACQVIYVQARDQETYASYILPQLNMLQTEITSKFGQMWTRQTLQDTSIPLSNLQAAPQALSPAIGFSTFNLRPFAPAAATPAVTIGLIYLIIIAFFSFSFFLPIYMKFASTPGHPSVTFPQLVLIRWLGANSAYFLMSLAYSLISLAFQIPFSNGSAPATAVANNPNAYGKASFVVYWMVNFLGMSALGLACENMAMLIGFPWTSMWLIFWVITNVSTSFYSLDLAPKFYYWGYAWPLQNIVEASRRILFDLHSRLGLNFGILFAWVAINTILFPLCCWVMRWKTIRQKKKVAQH